MSSLDAAVLASLRELSTEVHGDEHRFRGTMLFSDALVGPPGRVHGGIHPLVRTLPILARLRGETNAITRLRIDAALQKALPLGETVGFDGVYRESGASFVLETRFLGSDRLRATASSPTAEELPGGDALARFGALFERAASEPSETIHVLGVRYHVTPSVLFLDLRSLDSVDEGAHLRKALLPTGGLGLAALSTQLDAVGASARGVLMRHPHFTTHISLAFDLEGLEPGTPVLVLADRTTIVEDPDSAEVDVRGTRYGTARIEAVVVDARFERCFGHAHVTVHPVDPARFAGFEEMRRLRRA